MPLLFVEHGIVVIVAPLKLLGKQFVEVLAENRMNAVSMNASNELFKVTDLVVYNERWSIKTDCACRILQKVAIYDQLVVVSLELFLNNSHFRVLRIFFSSW